MARSINKLSTRQVTALTAPGKYMDGGGLRLVVDDKANKKWIFRYTREGKTREMGLGSASGVDAVSLAEAREKAIDLRRVLSDNADPLELKKATAAAEKIAPARKVPTFKTFVSEWLNGYETTDSKGKTCTVNGVLDGFSNEKHRDQWRMTLGDAYCSSIQSKSVNEITTSDVLAIVQPIWLTKSETARRIRGRIEAALDAAKAGGFREGENPARLKGHLATILPVQKKLSRGHHAAMPYEDVPDFVQKLGKNGSISALALELTILTAARSGEVRGAMWTEFDRDKKIWTVPASRMKARREHRVPLSDRCIEILEAASMWRNDDNDLVFPSTQSGTVLSDMALAMTLRREGAGAFTVHGFRSAFRDWAGEETHFPREVAEAALAHTVGDATERAYRRGDALEKRRKLMEAWEKHCHPRSEDKAHRQNDNVVALPSREQTA